MTRYMISNSTSGLDLGIYEGNSPEEAIQAMLDDAGHDGPADEAIVATEVDEEE